MKLQSGDIFFVMNHKNKISKAISSAMGSQWSHSGIIYEPANLATYTLETNDFCVTHGNFDDYLENTFSFEVYRLKKQDEIKTRNALFDTDKALRNKIYAYWQLISLGIRRIFNLQIPNFFRGNVVCCGVVVDFLNRIDVKYLGQIEPQDVDTEELYRLILATGEFELVLKKNAI